jgi:hypothetical protein
MMRAARLGALTALALAAWGFVLATVMGEWLKAGAFALVCLFVQRIAPR